MADGVARFAMTIKECHVMKTNTDYEIFGSLMTEYCLYVNPGLSFRVICRMFGLARRALDRMLVSELGVGGQELIMAYRTRRYVYRRVPEMCSMTDIPALSAKESGVKGFK